MHYATTADIHAVRTDLLEHYNALSQDSKSCMDPKREISLAKRIEKVQTFLNTFDQVT